MDISKLNSLRDRLKAQGAQMGRIVSAKMKDLLQPSSPESKMVDDATSENLPEPNWSMNMRICAMINREELRGTEVMRVIKKKLSTRNEVVQRLSLDLLEACAMNCEKAFSEIASEKVLEVMTRVIESPEEGVGIRKRAWELIRAWGELRDLAYLPVFKQTYVSLNSRRANRPIEDGGLVPLESLIGSDLHHQQVSPAYGANDFSAEEKREIIVGTRSTLDLLLSMLKSETKQKPSEDEVLTSLLEKCRESLSIVQLIVECTGDDEGMLFEALNLHDELQGVITKCGELEETSQSFRGEGGPDVMVANDGGG